MEPTRVTVDATADVTVARIDGELDKLAADAVRSRLDDLGGERLVIDLGGVTFLDSAGLHALFELGRAIGERGGRLALAVVEGSAAGRVVELAHLAAVIPVHGSVAEATQALGSVS